MKREAILNAVPQDALFNSEVAVRAARVRYVTRCIRRRTIERVALVASLVMVAAFALVILG